MLLNRNQNFAFCVDPESGTAQWQRISAGLYQIQSSHSDEKLRFFALGRESQPEQELQSSVKVYTLLMHRLGDDAAQELLLSLHGKSIGFLRWHTAKNGENKGKICTAAVEVSEAGNCKADDPQTYAVKLLCGAETEVTVNDLTFTA